MYVVNPSMLFSTPNLIVSGLFPGPYEMLIVICHSITICNNSQVSDTALYYKPMRRAWLVQTCVLYGRQQRQKIQFKLSSDPLITAIPACIKNGKTPCFTLTKSTEIDFFFLQWWLLNFLLAFVSFYVVRDSTSLLALKFPSSSNKGCMYVWRDLFSLKKEFKAVKVLKLVTAFRFPGSA